MDRVDILRSARQNYSVAWSIFISSYNKKPEQMFCFFEGEDAKYYGIRIDMIIASVNRKNMICSGKKGVLHIRDLISNEPEYKDAWVAYFIDNDFDEDNPELIEDIYVTPCYSIENLYVTPTAFSRLVQDEFEINESDEEDSEYFKVFSLYTARLREFCDVTEELNAWLYLQRLKEKKLNKGAKINANNVNLSNLFTLSLEGVKKQYTIETINEIFPDTYVISKRKVRAQVKVFRNVDRILFFRGKYLIEFLRVFVSQLRMDKNSPVSNKSKVINLSKKNILSELSQYADTPSSLTDFLVTLSRNKS